MVERFPFRDDGPLVDEPEQRAGRAPDHRHQPAVEPALGPAPEPARQPARGRRDEPAPRPRRCRDLRGRQGLRRHRTSRRPTSGGGSAFALTGAAEPPAWNRPARPYDLDDAKGVIELLCRRLGLRGAGVRTARPTIRTCIPAGRPRVAAGGDARRPGRRAASRDARRARPARRAGPRRRARDRRARRRPARRRRGSSPPSRHPVGRARPGGHRRRGPAGGRRRGRRSGATAARCCGTSSLFDIYRGRPLAETEKSLAWRLTFAGDDRTLTEAEVDDAVAAITAGLARDVGGPAPDLTAAGRPDLSGTVAVTLRRARRAAATLARLRRPARALRLGG